MKMFVCGVCTSLLFLRLVVADILSNPEIETRRNSKKRDEETLWTINAKDTYNALVIIAGKRIIYQRGYSL